jgi:2,3-bisphosphoglycerate-independent phosphoglycerate mutase
MSERSRLLISLSGRGQQKVRAEGEVRWSKLVRKTWPLITSTRRLLPSTIAFVYHLPRQSHINMAQVAQKAVLICIDGWGVAGQNSPDKGNAILNADTPWMDEFAKDGSNITEGYTELEASSLAVGLPEGLMGNSEVGHLNIGAGRVVWQDVVRIDQTIKKGELNKVDNIVKSFTHAKEGNGRLHLLGLVSDGGVHSHINHLLRLLEVAKEIGVPEVYIHFFGDGRDTDPKSGAGHMQTLLDHTKKIGLGKIATVVGRYWAMDRDKRWDRVEQAMDGIFKGEGEESSDPVKTINERYEQGETDEFLKPIIVNGKDGRVQGMFCPLVPYLLTLTDSVRQTTTLSSSSTTAPTVSARSLSSSATRTAAPSPTSPTPPT